VGLVVHEQRRAQVVGEPAQIDAADREPAPAVEGGCEGQQVPSGGALGKALIDSGAATPSRSRATASPTRVASTSQRRAWVRSGWEESRTGQSW